MPQIDHPVADPDPTTYNFSPLYIRLTFSFQLQISLSSRCEVYESYERQTREAYDGSRSNSRGRPQRYGNPAVGHKAQDGVHKIINLLASQSYDDSRFVFK